MTRVSSASLIELLDPATLADPYPLYEKLRRDQPVYWDPYLHAWVVTRYADVARVLSEFRASRTHSPEKLRDLGMEALTPIAAVMVRQMLFLDPPQHGRVRALASAAFTARRVEHLRNHIREITDDLLDRVEERGSTELMADFAAPLPAIVTAEMLGVPTSDHEQLKIWSADFAEMLGNFQHNPGRTDKVLRSLNEMTAYFQVAVRNQETRPTQGLINALLSAEINGDRLSEDEIVANVIVTMVGGQETTTNLIGNGLLTLLRNREAFDRVVTGNCDINRTVEELLRYESPSQQTARLAPADVSLGGEHITRGQAVIAVMGSANRDSERFSNPDVLDIDRSSNRHLAFGWAAHFCFGAPLARIEGQIAFERLLRRFPGLRQEPGPVRWRPNLGLRGLEELHLSW